jgi:FkbM family methyltransferase
MCQFLTSLRQIANSESVGTLDGVRRHLHWQMRRVLKDFPCDLPISNSRLRVHCATGVAALVNAMGEYDYNNMRFVKTLLQRLQGLFVDVGANIGTYTLIASEVENARVIALEPHPATFAVLAENVRLNQRSNVTCLNVAASSRDAEVQFTDEKEPALNRVVHRTDGNPSILRVPGRRLETLCRSLGAIPDLIKIDVEGHEPEVLEGLGELRHSAKAIFVEGGERETVRQWMSDAGYIGPFFVHFNQRLISSQAQPRREDPVFIQHSFLSDLEMSKPRRCEGDFRGTLDSQTEECRGAGIWH